jgi:hypothetical protein
LAASSIRIGFAAIRRLRLALALALPFAARLPRLALFTWLLTGLISLGLPAGRLLHPLPLSFLAGLLTLLPLAGFLAAFSHLRLLSFAFALTLLA